MPDRIGGEFPTVLRPAGRPYGCGHRFRVEAFAPADGMRLDRMRGMKFSLIQPGSHGPKAVSQSHAHPPAMLSTFRNHPVVPRGAIIGNVAVCGLDSPIPIGFHIHYGNYAVCVSSGQCVYSACNTASGRTGASEPARNVVHFRNVSVDAWRACHTCHTP